MNEPQSPDESNSCDESAGQEHPASVAWMSLWPSHSRPSQVELLGNRLDRVVYRLHFSSPDSPSRAATAIAVYAPQGIAEIEQIVCTQLLHKIAMPALEWYGQAVSGDRAYRWFFTGDAGNEWFDPAIESHRILSASWLAMMHLATGDLAPPEGIPRRGAAEMFTHVQSALHSLNLHGNYPGMTNDQLTMMRILKQQFETIPGRWDEIESACAAAPSVLIHGDFANRNLRVIEQATGQSLIPFDWEDATWGPPALDIMHTRPRSSCEAANPDLPTYCALVQHRWPQFDIAAARYLGTVGRLFWFILAVASEVEYLDEYTFTRRLRHLRQCRAGMADVLRALRWNAS